MIDLVKLSGSFTLALIPMATALAILAFAWLQIGATKPLVAGNRSLSPSIPVTG